MNSQYRSNPRLPKDYGGRAWRKEVTDERRRMQDKQEEVLWDEIEVVAPPRNPAVGVIGRSKDKRQTAREVRVEIYRIISDALFERGFNEWYERWYQKREFGRP